MKSTSGHDQLVSLPVLSTSGFCLQGSGSGYNGYESSPLPVRRGRDNKTDSELTLQRERRRWGRDLLPGEGDEEDGEWKLEPGRGHRKAHR